MLNFLIFGILITTVISQRSTPCPETFSYEVRKEGRDRWYGQIKYSSPKNITGIWFHITLDRPADILGNWFGHVTTIDNTVYVIRNQDFRLAAGASLNIRFFVKFNLAHAIPSLERIKLNGNIICSNAGELKPTTPKTNFIQLRPTGTSNHAKNESDGKRQDKYVRPDHPGSSLSVDDSIDSESDGDPPGDFDIEFLPQSRIATGRKASYCGVTTPRDTETAVNDDDTWPGKWPWHGALYRTQETNLAYICGITLITEQHVLVPAHCVTRYHTERIKQSNNFLVILGKYNLNRFGPQVQQRSVTNIFVHPEYNHTMYTNDIAVLKLSKTIKITNFVKPCCLGEDDHSSKDIRGKEGIIVGWGLDKRHMLLQTEMSVVPLEDCFFPHSTLGRNYCAVFENVSSACKVRSIGGMVLPREAKEGQDTVWEIRGINIFSEVQTPCNTSHSIIFTDVAKYTPWIKSVTSDSD